MTTKMTQSQIDALLKESICSEQEPKSDINAKQDYGQEEFQSYQQSHPNPHLQTSQNYASEHFQSYEESRSQAQNNSAKPQHKLALSYMQQQLPRKPLADIREEPSPPVFSQAKRNSVSKQRVKAKTSIYFYPPKKNIQASVTQHLPRNYANLEEREKELLLTTLDEDNRRLKSELQQRVNQFTKLERVYKVVLKEKAEQSPSVKQIALEKQLSCLQSRYARLQGLCKVERQRNIYRVSTGSKGMVPEERAGQREEDLLDIIDKLKERLTSTATELKTLQNKMSQGEDYIDQLKRKMKRVEQMEYKLQKMAEQAANDQQYICQLRNANHSLETKVFEMSRQQQLGEVELRRYQLGQATQAGTLAELKEVRKEKGVLEERLREFAGNMMCWQEKSKKVKWQIIEDSGQLLKS